MLVEYTASTGLRCVKHLHDRIFSLRGEICFHKSSLNPPHFIEVPVLSSKVNGYLWFVMVICDLLQGIFSDRSRRIADFEWSLLSVTRDILLFLTNNS